MSETVQCDALVLGAGVVGLAAAAQLSKSTPHLVVLEAHEGFGRETSSRNSEVIHSGIYYPADSLKTTLCLRGRSLLYSFCERYAVTFRKCGKSVQAAQASELPRLEQIFQHARTLGVASERVAAGEIFFPESGIVNSHEFLAALEARAVEQGALLLYRHRVTGVRRKGANWELNVETPAGPLIVVAEQVVNAMGLAAAHWSNEALTTSHFEHRFCRGRYFQLSHRYRDRFSHLVYPIPEADGLGVHVTIDTGGFARLGPDVEWCSNSDLNRILAHYQCDWETLRPRFLEAGQRLIPDLSAGDLTPGTVGIRPKLFIDGKPHPDFLLENHDGWIHCLGIESPGLTAALAIGEKVAQLAERE